MARLPRIVFEGALYHVTFRGNGRQDVFLDPADFERMQLRMGEAVEDCGVRLLMYCLLSNHGHMVIQTPKGNLSDFMGRLLTGYAVYFNRRHQRVGHLFQGRFGSRLVEGDGYLLKLSRYVHLNPVQVVGRRGASLPERLKVLRAYRWSSYRAYAGSGPEEAFVTYTPIRSAVPGRGEARGRYRRFVEAGLVASDEEFASLMKERSPVIGDEEARGRLKEVLKQKIGRLKREDVSLRRMQAWEEPERVLADVCKQLGVERTALMRKSRDATARGLAAYALVRRSGLTQREAGLRLGIGTGAAVSMLVRGIKNRSCLDHQLARCVHALCGDN